MDVRDKVELESKQLYRNNASKFLTQKSQLKKETEFLDKWQGVAERNIGKEEDKIRKKLQALNADKAKYNLAGSPTSVNNEHDPKIGKGQRITGHEGKHSHNYHHHEREPSPMGRRTRRASLDAGTQRYMLQHNKDSNTQTQKQKEKQEFEDRRLRRKSIPASGMFSTHPKAIPMVVITDETGASRVAFEDGRKANIAPPPTPEEIDDLYTMAMSYAINKDEIMGSPRSRCHTHGKDSQASMSQDHGKTYFDLAKLKEVEELLKETSSYRRRHKKSPSDHHGAKLQQRRIEKLKEIMESLKKPNKQTFSPMQMLNCSYLRLSKNNVDELEEMVRAAGQDPGLHYHSDISNYDLFEELRKEAELAQRVNDEERLSFSQISSKPPTGRRRASIY